MKYAGAADYILYHRYGRGSKYGCGSKSDVMGAISDAVVNEMFGATPVVVSVPTRTPDEILTSGRARDQVKEAILSLIRHLKRIRPDALIEVKEDWPAWVVSADFYDEDPEIMRRVAAAKAYIGERYGVKMSASSWSDDNLGFFSVKFYS